jgi:hypothetical protein
MMNSVLLINKCISDGNQPTAVVFLGVLGWNVNFETFWQDLRPQHRITISLLTGEINQVFFSFNIKIQPTMFLSDIQGPGFYAECSTDCLQKQLTTKIKLN